MNPIFVKYLDDLSLIERVMLKTYGENGKTALIQSVNKNTSISSFMSTNDGSCLLNSMEFTDNQLLKIISNTVKNHSNQNGDNCKSLFIYCYNLLNNLTTYRNTNEKSQVVNYLRVESISRIYELLHAKWINNKKFLFKISTSAEFLDYLPSMSVLYDLKNLNPILSGISSDLVLKLIIYFLEKTDNLLEAKEKLIFIADHLEEIVIFSEKYLLSKSNFYSDGFYIDRRFNIGSISSLNESNIKAIFLIRQVNESSSKSNTFVSIDCDLAENIFKYFHVGNEQQFPDDFLNSLKQNDIRLVLACGYLTEMQKSQLNSIRCSLISYIDVDYVNFICSNYGFNPVFMSECDKVSLNEHVIQIESVENLDDEQLFYLKLHTCHSTSKMGFIQFCSPVKMFFHQFKIYFHKVVKTLLIILETSHLILKWNRFERVSAKLCKHLAEANDCSDGERMFFKFLNVFFESLEFKFQKCNFLNDREYLLSVQTKKDNDINEKENEESVFYEPFDLKLKCLMQSLNVAQHALKIDSVCFVKNSLKSLNLSSD
jgi:hypothetical protein